MLVALQSLEPQLADAGTLDRPIAESPLRHEQTRPLDCTSLRAQHKHWIGIGHGLINLQPGTRAAFAPAYLAAGTAGGALTCGTPSRWTMKASTFSFT